MSRYAEHGAEYDAEEYDREDKDRAAGYCLACGYRACRCGEVEPDGEPDACPDCDRPYPDCACGDDAAETERLIARAEMDVEYPREC